MNWDNLLKEINRIGRNLSSILSELPVLEERNLKYRDGAYGITELLSCPKKAEIRRKLWKQGIELDIESQEIEDGFLFENLVKLALANLYREKFTPEKVLPYDFEIDGETFKIDGHLDCFIEFKDKVVGIEVKHTNLNFDNELTGKPPQLIILSPDDRKRININYKYYLQAQIQKFLLQKLYPNKKVETYLLVKTQLRTKWKLGKTTVVLPVERAITEEQLKEICRLFRKEKKPRAEWECKLCLYKEHGFCDGMEETATTEALKEEKIEIIDSLLSRRAELVKEVKAIEEQLKKLIDGEMEWNGKRIGWITKTAYSYNLPLLSKLLKSKGIRVADYLQIKGSKIRELEKILGEDIEKARTAQKKKRFILL